MAWRDMLASSREEGSKSVSCMMGDLLQLERCNGFRCRAIIDQTAESWSIWSRVLRLEFHPKEQLSSETVPTVIGPIVFRL